IMKKLVLIFILLFSINGFSQHPELLDREWFLHKLVIEGEDIFPPVNWEVGHVIIIFYNDGFDTGVCNGVTTYVTYNEYFSFFIDESYITAEECTDPENQPFNNLYISFFVEYLNDDFYYLITSDTNENKYLVITNGNSDEAHYGNMPLSIEEFDALSMRVYPNPVANIVHINSTDIISEVSVYDIQGKVIKTVSGINSNTSEIGLSSL